MNRNDVLYVLVLYRCSLKDSKTYRSLLYKKEVNIYIYDNSPEPSTECQNYPELVEYVHDPKNSGLSVAYNSAAKYAQTHGYSWLLLLDQDTTFPAGALDVYFKAVIEHPQIQMFAPKHKISDGRYISPTRYFIKTSHPVKKVKEGVISFSQACPINSGVMVSVDSFFHVGGYDEEVTLDFSDIRFMEKYKKSFKSFCCIDVVCFQDYSINEKDVNKLLSRFKIFLKCASACKRDSLGDSIGYLFTTLKRTIRLTIDTHNAVFLHTYYHEYLLQKR